MSDSTTAHYGWAYPTVNADANTWGTTLNSAIIAVDAQMHANAVTACQAANNLSDLANAGTARTNLGLGSAATQASSAFDTAGAASAAQSAAQGSSCQRASNLSDLSNAGTARSNLGLGSAATQSSGAFDAAGAASAAQSAAQGSSCQRASNLGDVSSAASARSNLGLGSVATHNITISSGAPSGGSDGDIWFQYS